MVSPGANGASGLPAIDSVKPPNVVEFVKDKSPTKLWKRPDVCKNSKEPTSRRNSVAKLTPRQHLCFETGAKIPTASNGKNGKSGASATAEARSELDSAAKRSTEASCPALTAKRRARLDSEARRTRKPELAQARFSEAARTLDTLESAAESLMVAEATRRSKLTWTKSTTTCRRENATTIPEHQRALWTAWFESLVA